MPFVSRPNISSQASHQPPSDLQFTSRKRLRPEEWDALAVDLMQGVEAALADREPLDDNLDDWNALYEMESDKDPNWPVINAANVFVPLIPTQLEALNAYIAGQVLVPNPFMVTGLTPEAAQDAHMVERYYNAEYKRQRGSTTWFNEFVKWLHLSLRDGAAYMEVLWKYEKTKLRINQSQPRMETDPESGLPAPALDDEGNPVYDQVEVEVEKITNEADVRAVPLRNVILLPASAKSIEEAKAVIRVLYPYEQDLKKLINDGVLDAEEVELALQMVPAGTTELSSSPQPLGEYRRGGQTGIGAGQGTQSSKFFKNRGPLEIYRIHSNQYDLDNDGTTEENIFWVHRATWRLLGWKRYQYFADSRPLFSFAPLPRPDDEIGFSLPGRLAGLQNEKNAQRNQRLDESVLRLAPPFIRKKGSALEDQDMAWGANQVWETEDPQGDFRRVEMEQLPQSSYLEEQIIDKDAQDYTGLAQTAIGQQSSGRRSATEARARQAAAMTRTGLIAMHFRMSIRPVINFIHALNKQYKNTDQQFQVNQDRFNLTLQQLNQDYSIDVVGSSDPIDAPARRTETIGAADVFMKFPAIAQNPMRQYYLLRKIAETFNWADIDQIIGTEQDAQQMAQQMQQQAALAAQQGVAPNGQHPQPAQHPAQPKPPGMP